MQLNRRNPFARHDVIRESCGSGKCDWCGQKRKVTFQYGIDPDSGRKSWINGQFCNIECAESYNGGRIE